MSQDSTTQVGPNRELFLLTLGALGIVYGDIGTSPLYAMRECFFGTHGIGPSRENILGVLSLITWTLLIVVTCKYLFYIMRADNRGEGGTFALLALLLPAGIIRSASRRSGIYLLGILGASLIYGDGVITPAISVLSAVEGLVVATPIFQPYVMPLSLTILVFLFLVQHRGTGNLGNIFGPVMLFWFSTLAFLGVVWIIKAPSVLEALNPWYALTFLLTGDLSGFKVLGAVFLVATGAEALYADMGHFGRRPIRIGWLGLVCPSLLLNYFGQGALILSADFEVSNPFFQLAPSWAILPLVALSTAATVIAAQALISGAFSITRQAVQLGFLPRMQIHHTSSKQIGQIYIPVVNYLLLAATIILVMSFHSSSNLAAAYGLSVSLVMLITTVLVSEAAVHLWGWRRSIVLAITLPLVVIDLLFFGANLIKFFEGGWVAFLIALISFTFMTTWWTGRRILAWRLRENALPLEKFIERLQHDDTIRVPGTSIFMARDIDRTPAALIHNVKHNKVVHKTVILLCISTEEKPSVASGERLLIESLNDGFYRVTIRYGFMDQPNIPQVLKELPQLGIDIDLEEATFFLGRETILASDKAGMALWREKLFSFTTRIAARPTTFFQIPPHQVIEIGHQVEI